MSREPMKRGLGDDVTGSRNKENDSAFTEIWFSVFIF